MNFDNSSKPIRETIAFFDMPNPKEFIEIPYPMLIEINPLEMLAADKNNMHPDFGRIVTFVYRFSFETADRKVVYQFYGIK